ncbi:hypothetical protein T07_6244, partial [Trichinella nelsoni]
LSEQGQELVNHVKQASVHNKVMYVLSKCQNISQNPRLKTDFEVPARERQFLGLLEP